MFRYLISLFIITIFIINCSGSSNNKSQNALNDNETPEIMYIEAKLLFDSKNLELSEQKFTDLRRLFPLSNEAIQSEFMIGFINYLRMNYATSISQFKKIINSYPSHKDLDYAYYMIALCDYEQITHESLDGSYNDLALDSFNQVINRFPDSKYAKDSRQKIILIKSNKAAKHMAIGRFYLNEKKFTAALNRFNLVVENYSMTKFTPEALHRMVEIYYQIGMEDESNKTASVLGYNYPKSIWYKYSYDLLNQNEKKGSLFSKLSNVF